MQCPHLSRLVDLGKAELARGNFKALYYTIEDFLPGRTLEQQVRDGETMTSASARHCLAHALRGLGALHSQHVLHGNLHSGKLYLDPETGDLHIADLSLAFEAPAKPAH